MSPSTEGDRGLKFEQYRRLKSFREYVVIAQDRVHVEHFTRQEGGSWVMRETGDRNTSIPLASIECVINLTEAYELVDLADQA